MMAFNSSTPNPVLDSTWIGDVLSLTLAPNVTYLTADAACKVCGDRASGTHYGALSCEGCKGFFKRSIRRGLGEAYVCRGNQDCPVTKADRNRCQYCRFQMCFHVGMRKLSVQQERKPSSNVGRRPRSTKTGMMSASVTPIPSPPLSGVFGSDDSTNGSSVGANNGFQDGEENEEMQTENTDDGKEDMENVMRSINNVTEEDTARSDIFASIDPDYVVPEESVPFTFRIAPTPGVNDDIARVNEYASRLLFLTVHWTKSLPAFQAFSQEMQVEVLKSSWTQLFTVGLLQTQNVLELSDVLNSVVNHYYTQFNSAKVVAVHKHMQTLSQVVKSARSLELDDFECAALKCLILFSPDRVAQFGDSIVNAVKEFQARISRKFAEYQEDKFRLAEILLLLPQLCSIGSASLDALFFTNLSIGMDAIIPSILILDLDSQQEPGSNAQM